MRLVRLDSPETLHLTSLFHRYWLVSGWPSSQCEVTGNAAPHHTSITPTKPLVCVFSPPSASCSYCVSLARGINFSNLLRSTIKHPATPSSLRTGSEGHRTRSSSPRTSNSTPAKLRSRESSPQVGSPLLRSAAAAAEDIPLENLSRSSTPVLGGKPIPIAVANAVNSAHQLRSSPKKNNSFDGGISVSSSPSTSILGTSSGGGGSPAGLGVISNSMGATSKVVVVSQETSFMGGPEEVVAVEVAVEQGEEGALGENDEQQQQTQHQAPRRKGTIETV